MFDCLFDVVCCLNCKFISVGFINDYWRDVEDSFRRFEGEFFGFNIFMNSCEVRVFFEFFGCFVDILVDGLNCRLRGRSEEFVNGSVINVIGSWDNSDFYDE